MRFETPVMNLFEDIKNFLGQKEVAGTLLVIMLLYHRKKMVESTSVKLTYPDEVGGHSEYYGHYH